MKVHFASRQLEKVQNVDIELLNDIDIKFILLLLLLFISMQLHHPY